MCTKKILNLRKSRSTNKNFRILRNSKRAVASRRCTDIDLEIIKSHEERMKEREEKAIIVKVRKATNRAIMNAQIGKHNWPSQEKMSEFVELTSLSEIAKAVGVSVSRVALKCKQWGIKAKPPEYWTYKSRLKVSELMY